MATYTVTTMDDVVDADDGVLSLREAISASNSASGVDTISFAADVQGGTLILTQGELVADDDITIDGGTGVTISGNDSSRVLRLTDYASATLDSITVRDGNGLGGGYTDRGGGILVGTVADLTLINSTITGNTSASNGGGVFLRGTLTLTDSTISDNTAGGQGGGASAYVVHATRSTISGNSGTDGGGFFANSAATVTDSTIFDNTATGDGAEGGGIYVYLTPIASGERGLQLLNSTVVGNEAAYRGGGVKVRSSGDSEIANSIVAGNSVTASGQGSYVDISIRTGAIFSPISSNGHNVFGTDINVLNAGDAENVPVSLIFGTPTLANNGGPTKTLALLADAENPAIFGADPDDTSATDQRGVARPLPSGTDPDIGAFESDLPTPALLSVTSADANRLEGDTGTTDRVFTITRTGNTELAVTVNWAVTAGTADAADFGGALPSGSVTFAAGETEKTVTIQVQGDTVLEFDESFAFVLTRQGTDSLLVQDRVAARIVNDDGGLAGLIVTTTADVVDADDGVQSLREVIAAAEVLDGADTVRFAPSVQGQTVVLTEGELVANGELTINGGTGVTISADGDSRVLRVTANSNVELDGLIITGGSAADGGGILVEGDGALQLTEAVVTGNSASGGGGGVYGARFSTVTLTDTTVSDNIASSRGGGVFGWDVRADRSTISGNDAGAGGGGIYALARAVVTDSTIYDNSGRNGGGLNVGDFGTPAVRGLRLINSTVVDNSASNAGGGVTFTTSGGGYLANSIVAGNTAGYRAPDLGFDRFVSAPISSNGKNIFGTSIDVLDAGDREGVSTSLLFAGGLADNGGPTRTLALREAADNPALFGADPALASATDQRGVARPWPDGSNPDIGAFESSFGRDALLTLTAADAVKPEGDTGSTAFTFTVSRTGLTTTAVSADWAVSGGTADSGDFGGTLPSGTVSFAAGESEQTITVLVQGDTAFEPDETFQVVLSNPSANASVGTGSAGGTIGNDDLQPLAVLAIETLDADKAEGDGGTTDFTFTVRRSGELGGPASAAWDAAGSTFAGNAAADANDFPGFILPRGTVEFAAGEIEKTVTVGVQGDGFVEGDEAFTVTLSNPVAGTAISATQGAASGVIRDDEVATVSIEAVDAERLEGTGGGLTEFTFKVTRTGFLPTTAEVDWTISGDVDGSDFNAMSGRTFVLANQTERTFSVVVNQDDLVELDEDFTVTLSNPGSQTEIGTASASGTILNDDLASPALSISALDADKDEGNDGTTDFTFQVTRTGDTTGVASARWAVSGAAVDRFDFADFALPSGAVSFAAGEATQTITVRVLGDVESEGDESFQVALSDPTDATVATGTAIGTIRDDEVSILNIASGDYSVIEGDTGATELSFTVFRDGAFPFPEAASFDWAISGDADAADFVGGTLPSGSFTFEPGEYFDSITVEIQGDTEIEPDESLTLTLSNPSDGAVLGSRATATGTIETDDFDTPVLSVATTDAERDEGNSGTTAFTFTVTRLGVTSVAASAAWAVSGNAVDAADFAGGALPTGTVEFAAGETERTITIEVEGDTEVEYFEDFELTLSDPSDGVQIRTASAFGTIFNDDFPPAVLSVAALDADKPEGDSGTTAFSFTVTRAGEEFVAAAATWTVGGDVDAADFAGGVLPTGTVSFDPGETERTITVEVQGDTEVEPDEDFALILSEPSDGAELGTATAQGTIENDDAAAPAVLSVVAQDAFRFESDGGPNDFIFLAVRTGNTDIAASADWTVGGSGVDRADFVGGVLPTGSVRFAADQEFATIRVAVRGDTTVEADEVFTLTLSNPGIGTELAADTATTQGTIRNDDVALPAGEIVGTNRNDRLTGTEGADVIRGRGEQDQLFGRGGDDRLFGDGGQDRLEGGAGLDRMTGGSGEDRFVFRLASDAPATGPGYDEILDFVRSDKIDLRAIDANAGASGNQAFRFIAGQPLSGPAQLNVQAFEGDLLVTGSTNADAAAAFAFVVRTDLASLRAADFVL